jgi:hypothetical protein
VDVDTQAKAVAKRVISNSNYASLYFGYFEASTDFLSANDGRLDHDAEQMLLMLRVGLPRLSALCLCRLWDKPGKDRHSPARSNQDHHVCKSCWCSRPIFYS